MISFLLPILITLLGTLAVEIEDNSSNRIINGYNAKNWSFYVRLLIYRQLANGTLAGTRCGGSVIQSDVILTAAHCIKNQYLGVPVIVEYGDFTREGGYKPNKNIIESWHWVFHPDYSYDTTTGTTTNDIGLVYLPRKLPKTSRPISLCTSTDFSKYSYNYFAIGMGATRPSISDPNLPAVLQEVPLVETQHCMFNIDPKLEVCLHGANGKGSACIGDSGGPLFPVRRLWWPKEALCLYGVASYVTGGEIMCGGDSVYTRVSGYLDWIEENL